MKVDFAARQGTITVTSMQGTWTDIRLSVDYEPGEGRLGEVPGSLPPLTQDEIERLIKTMEFVLEHAE